MPYLAACFAEVNPDMIGAGCSNPGKLVHPVGHPLIQSPIVSVHTVKRNFFYTHPFFDQLDLEGWLLCHFPEALRRTQQRSFTPNGRAN